MEIKYKAYLKNENRIIDVKSIDFENRQIIYENKSCDFNDCKLLQYTQIKDKNKKEIFEGDIVELYCDLSKTKWRAVVEFGNPNGEYTWGWQLKPIGDTAKKYGFNLDILCWVEMEEVGAYCEIIGNIYDNAELLKEKENELLYIF